MAPYNWAVELTQGEFKGYLDRWSWKAAGTGSQALLAECAAHDLNHQPRRCLGAGAACRAYFGKTRIRYSMRKRASGYRWVRYLAAEVSVRAGEPAITPASWRIAAPLCQGSCRMILNPLLLSILGVEEDRSCDIPRSEEKRCCAR
jgi:hypothetical protein